MIRVEDDVHMTPDGLLLGREGAHSRWRVLHAGGDATGAEIERALINASRKRPEIKVYEETFVKELLLQDGRCIGLQALDRTGQPFELQARSIVLASGGAGSLWLHTSNPAGATADGLALAWRAGAALSDLEFMQFHPTVLVSEGSSHLISEAVRGEGAYLRNHAGERFMPRYSSQEELAPRDVVARAILSEMIAEHSDCQYLDLRHLSADKVYARFPTIAGICKQNGLDLATDLLPIAPAAHYCMGGVMVDTFGRTTVPNLYAVGEVACTGVHGANRLASNSLLEGLVYGIRIADLLADGAVDKMKSNEGTVQRTTSLIAYEDQSGNGESLSLGRADNQYRWQIERQLRELMWKYVSLVRDREGLLTVMRQIQQMRQSLLSRADQETIEIANMLQMAELVVVAALERCESRGSHWRLDYQHQDEKLARQHYAFHRLHIGTYELLDKEVEPYV